MLPSCGDNKDYEGKTVVLQDSLVNVFPTWQALKVKVVEDKTVINVIIGDATFYKASETEKQQKADELAAMIERIYGPGNRLQQGNLVVTDDIHNNSETPPNGITVPLHFKDKK